jgi:hypothetical protein
MSTRFVVMKKPDTASGPRYTIKRDGWSWLAFIAPVRWLLWNRVWFAAFLFILVSVAIAVLANEPGFLAFVFAAGILVQFYAGLEANHWHISALTAKGWQPVQTVDANAREEAELRFALQRSGRTAPPPVPGRAMLPAMRGSDMSSPDLLFAEPGRG